MDANRKTLTLSFENAILKSHDAGLAALIGEQVRIMFFSSADSVYGTLVASDRFTLSLKSEGEITTFFKHALAAFAPYTAPLEDDNG